VNEQVQPPTKDQELPPARELAVWLRALQSFFNQSNHPFTQAERADISVRSFKCETRVVRDVLLRCLHLVGRVTQGEPASALRGEGMGAEAVLVSPSGQEEALGLADARGSLGVLSDVLKDTCQLSESLLESSSVGYGGWSGLGNVLTRELRRSESVQLFLATGHDGGAEDLQEPLATLTLGLTPDEFGEDMSAIFSTFVVLLGRLRFIEASLKSDGQLKRLLPIFTLVHEETRSLLDFIEGRALRVEGVEHKVREILDGTAYAIRMELRKAFEHELVGLCALRHPPQAFAKVENANGLLRDCYQQSVVALANCFDPVLDGKHLFNSFQTKLAQSLSLRRDLWKIVRLVRQASSREGGETLPSSLLEHLDAFREGGQRYLMYKDWEPFERFVEDVETARNTGDLSQTLHRFEAFLETLFGQVNMRAVLAEHPFDPEQVEG
jgi:hypothetical protein